MKRAIHQALIAIGERAHRSASGMSMTTRIELVRSCTVDWDGITAGTFYYCGRRDAFNGDTAKLPWTEFGRQLAIYAEEVVPKGTGVWFTPALSKNGRCRDRDIDEITQLDLDADAVGDWVSFRHVVDGAGLAHLVQRSSSHSPSTAKWHAHVPLAQYWYGTKPEWRLIYRHCVGWFSAASDLEHNLASAPPKYGFDKSTERLGQPFFLGTRRAEDAPTPETVCREGRALDLERFLSLTGFDVTNLDERAKPTRRRRRKPSRVQEGTSGSVQGFAALVFAAAGMLGSECGENKYSVICPWEAAHTTGEPLDSSTVVFAPGSHTPEGWFLCSHSHCEGKTLRDALLILPPTAVAAAMKVKRRRR